MRSTWITNAFKICKENPCKALTYVGYGESLFLTGVGFIFILYSPFSAMPIRTTAIGVAIIGIALVFAFGMYLLYQLYSWGLTYFNLDDPH